MPPGATTVMLPVTALVGTVKIKLVSVVTVNVAETPPISTSVAPKKFSPVSVTAAPAAAPVVEKP